MGDVYQDITNAVLAERRYQDERWGGPEHDDGNDQTAWVAFIREYAEGRSERAKKYNLGVRLVKCCALAVAAIQSAQRDKGGSNDPTGTIIDDATSMMTIADFIDPKDEKAVVGNLLKHLGNGSVHPRIFRDIMLCVIAYCVRVLRIYSENQLWPASQGPTTS